MKRFIIKFLILVVPFFLLWGLLEYAGQISGEMNTVDEIIAMQQEADEDFLIGMAYSGQQKFIDLYNVNKYKPECIALGTSRVMQFKGFCFRDDIAFYNTGGSVAENFDEYKNFLMNLEDDNLQMIILGLDSWIFNDAWNSKNCGDYSSFCKLEYSNEINRKSIYHSMITDFLEGKWTLGKLLKEKQNVGMAGKMRNSGYMQDGSYYYGNLYLDPTSGEDYMFADTFDRIENAGGRFEYGSEIDQETLDKLEDLLQYCKSQEIEVVGFIPPYAPTVYDRMMESGNYSYLLKIFESVRPIFESYGYQVFDYQNSKACFDCDDSYFVDGFHGSEVFYAMMLRDMAIESKELNNYISQEKIDELLDNRYSSVVFEKP